MRVESGARFVWIPSVLIEVLANPVEFFLIKFYQIAKLFAPFLCDHCNVNETARQYGSVFMFAFNIGMMDKGIPNRNRI